MRRIIVGVLAVIGGLFVLLLVLVALSWHFAARRNVPQIAASTILNLDLTKPVAEGPSPDVLSRILFTEPPRLRDVLDALQRAAGDGRVKGVVARLGNDEMGTATVQELREAIAAFRAKGKFAIAYADSFGEFSPGNRSYYLASAFDEIWLQPLGELGLTGLRAENPFLRGALDKLDIVPRLDHRSEYKSAMNTLTDKQMGQAQREELQAIVNSITGQMIREVAASRHLGETDLRRIIDAGPYQAQDAADLHLVDHVGYRDEAIAAARGRAGGIAALLGPWSYLDRAGRPNREGPVIALIHADGPITRGEGGENKLLGDGVMGSQSMEHAFQTALADAKVRAILLRIDSPGGSAVASETIWRETLRARAANIPVIVSMGDIAGSGGYYIAAGADKIVAQPATLTGSIGVVAGKMLTGGLWAKLGINWEAVQQGQNAGMYSSLEDFSALGQRRFETFLDTVYDGFKSRVAEGRHLDKETVEQIARGRVWTGEDAKTHGLVDELGGYDTALRLAKIAAQLNPDSPITLKTYPAEKPARQALTDWLLGRHRDDDDQANVAVFAGLGRLIRLGETAMGAIDALDAPAGSATMRERGVDIR